MKIVLPHDGSELADAAVPHALKLARVSGGEVVLLRIIEPAVDAMVADVHDDAGRVADAESALTDLVARLAAGGVRNAAVVVRSGYHPGSAIIDAASEFNCNIVVMTTHGRSGLSRTVLGSVADYVVRHTPGFPVLLCPPPGVASTPKDDVETGV